MAELLSQRIAVLANKKDAEELRPLLDALISGVRMIAAKLDADAVGAALNDTDYAAKFDLIIKSS